MFLRCLGVTETKVEIQGVRRKQYITRFSLKIGEESNKGITACILEVMSDKPLDNIEGGEDYSLILVNEILNSDPIEKNRIKSYLRKKK